MTRWSLGWGAAAAAASLLTQSPLLAFDRETLVDSGPAENRVNLYILGDGYTEAETSVLREEAVKIADLFLSQYFLLPYAQFINVHVIYSTSDCSGAREGDNPPSCTTIFDTYFNCNFTERLLCIGDESAVTSVLAADAPEYLLGRDIVLISVNDTKYGGSGGPYTTASRGEGTVHVAVHEIGHSFAGLGDEYEVEGGAGCGSPDCTEHNVTRYSERDDIKWSPWIEASTPLPTPETDEYTEVIGAFEGAMYSSLGVYRPKYDCKMRSQYAEFCEVCAEAWLWQLWASVWRVESFSPASQTLSLVQGTSQAFTYSGPKTSPNTITQLWRLDGAEVGDLESYTLDTCSLSVGSHTLALENTDTTLLVRRDPASLRTETTSWSITITRGPADACESGNGGATGSGGVSSGGEATEGGTASGGEATDGGTASGGEPESAGATSAGTASGGEPGSGGASAGGRASGGATSGGRANGGEPGAGGRPSSGGATSRGGTGRGGESSPDGGMSGESEGGAAGSPSQSGGESEGGATAGRPQESEAGAAGTPDATAGSEAGDGRSDQDKTVGCDCRVDGPSSDRSTLLTLVIAGLFGLRARRRGGR